MKPAPRPSRRQLALQLERESRSALPPATREAVIAALADLLLEALNTDQEDIDLARRGPNELESHQ